VVTVALPVMVVPEAAPAFTVTAIGIVEVPPFARLTLEVHVNVPAFPAVTPEQVTPAGGVALKKLVFEGVANTSFGSVSYTHLDVYKRQDMRQQRGVRRGNSRIAVPRRAVHPHLALVAAQNDAVIAQNADVLSPLP